MTNQKPTGIQLVWALVWALIVTALPNVSFAEDAMMEEVVVTGSRIKRIDAESVNPLVTISSQDIADAGFNNFQEVMDSLTQNAGGSLDQQQVFGFTPAASAVDLRGVGIGRTLTLIDGKRTNRYPIAAGGTINFSDTANVPLAAIERIEVLTSGASAIYGSDAMGGVINIITKDFYQGVNVGLRLSDTDDGGFGQDNISVMIGAGEEDRNILFLVEHERNERLKANQRMGFGDLGSDKADPGFGSYSSYGVSLLSFTHAFDRVTLQEPECSDRGLQRWDNNDICGFNRADRRDLYPKRDRTSLMTKWNYAFNDAVEFYGRVDYTKSHSNIQIEPMPVADYTYYVGEDPAGNLTPGRVWGVADQSGAQADFDQATGFGGDFATVQDGGYYYTRRMIEFGNRETDAQLDNYGALAGLRGDFGETWSWDLDWSFMRTEYEDRNHGYASSDSYFNYLTSGTSGRSQFDLMTQDEVDGASYTPFQSAQSSINQVSFGVTTSSLFELPAGGVGFAVGVESAREWFHNTSDSESIKGNILATGGSSGQGSRDYNALYTEFLFPVIESVEIQAALRYDDYSDFGDNIAPLIGAQWRPIDSLMFRASWAETFRAPDMQRVYGDPTEGFNQVTDPVACEFQGGSIGDENIPACNGEQYIDQTVGPNADLDAEEGENWNVGGVFQMGGFDASVDWWNVEITQIVNNPSAQTIASNPDIFGSLITRDAQMNIVHVNATAQNLTYQETEGVDLALGYNLPTEVAGVWDFRLKGTYMIKWKDQFDETSEITNVMEDDTVPDWRFNFTTNWAYGNWGATLFMSYISEMNGLNNELFTKNERSLTIDSQLKTNLSGYWGMDQFRVQVGVNNLTNEGPNVDETDTGWPFYPQEYFNGIGRQYYVRFVYNSGS